VGVARAGARRRSEQGTVKTGDGAVRRRRVANRPTRCSLGTEGKEKNMACDHFACWPPVSKRGYSLAEEGRGAEEDSFKERNVSIRPEKRRKGREKGGLRDATDRGGGACAARSGGRCLRQGTIAATSGSIRHWR
jgi:hypothetical protein